MPVGDVYMVRFRCQAGVQAGINIRHWRVFMEVGAGLTLTELATEFYGEFAALYQALLSDQAQFRTVAVQRILPLPAGPPGPDIGEPIPGAVAGDLLPRQSSGLIKLQSTIGGRSGRGRTYVPFPGEADNDVSATPVGSYVTRLDDLGDAFIGVKNYLGAGGSVSLEPVLVGGNGTLVNVLVTRQSRQAWATQRRRGALSPANPV